MRRTNRLLWNTLLVLGMVCMVLLMSGSARADSPYSIEGSSGSKTFYVTANGSCTLTFAQDYGTFMYQTGGTTAKGWGRYHVVYTISGSSYQYQQDWKRDTGTSIFSLTLPQAGQYTVTVTPYTPAEMRAEVNLFGYWTVAPTWALTGVSNGTASNTAPTATKTVRVDYKDISGNVLQTRTVSCKVGTNNVTAPSTITYGGAQYTLIGSSTQSVTLYTNGTLSTASLTFYYNRTATPTPVPKANCTVYYKDFSGSILQTRTVSCSLGANTVTAPSTITYGGAQYNLASSSTQTVTLYTNGTLSTASLTFYYNKAATPTPVPKANCTVYYKDFSGSILQTRTVSCSLGANTITAPNSITYGGVQYNLASSSTQTVTLYTSGNLSTSSLTFYYNRVVTPTPVPTTATCSVYYYDNTGRLLNTRTVTCSVGNNNITAPGTVTYGGVQYNLISPATQSVTMYTNGSLSTNSVTFYYAQQAATGTVTIRQIDTDTRATITSRTETLSTGTHTVYAGSTPSGYSPVGSTSATVTVTTSGAVSPSIVTFEYRKNGVEPITPPPGPGGRVYPSSWDTQFKPGTSKSERSVSTLPRLEDDSRFTSFYYTMWSSEKSDSIPELTAFFNGETVTSIGIIAGDASSETNYYNKAKPTDTTVIIYCDQGVVTREFTIRRGYTTNEQTFDLGNCTGVTKIEIFFRTVNIGQNDDTKYEVHVTELHFYN